MLESIGLKEAANKRDGRYKINCFLKTNKVPEFLTWMKLSRDLEYLDFRSGEKYSRLLLQCEVTKIDLFELVNLIDVNKPLDFYFISDNEYYFKKVIV